MRIAGFIKTTLDEWEGVGSCKVFIDGSRLRSPRPDTRRRDLTDVDRQAVLEYLDDRGGSLAGMIVCAGDLDSPGLLSFLKEVGRRGLKIRLDTDGMQPDALDDLIGARYADSVCIEIMAPLDNGPYRRIAGDSADVGPIGRSIGIVKESGIDCVFRTVAVPGIVDAESIAGIAASIGPGHRYRIVRFDPRKTDDPALIGLKPYSDRELAELGASAKRFVRDVRVADI